VKNSRSYTDDSVSGAEFANRPGAFSPVMNVIKLRPPFQMLVMFEESRLGIRDLGYGAPTNDSSESG